MSMKIILSLWLIVKLMTTSTKMEEKLNVIIFSSYKVAFSLFHELFHKVHFKERGYSY